VPAIEAGVILFRFGAFELDPKNAELRKGGILVKLAPQPFQLLQVLAASSGEIQTREQLQRQIWGTDTFVDFDRNLNVCMAQIRTALNDDAEAPRFVQTVPKRGYRFIAPVERVSTPAPPEPLAPKRARGFSWTTALAVADCCSPCSCP